MKSFCMSRPGTFRKWLIPCAAWITCVALVGYVMVFLEMPRRFQYVYQVRSDVESWQEGRSPERVPLYDVMRSPVQEKLTPEFVPTNDTAQVGTNEWHKHVDEGPMLEFYFFDGTKLHLSSRLSDEDRQYLMAAFWDERWSRWALWASVATPWIVAALVPPLLLFGALWLGHRFRSR
jgi:hypothetical protein